MLEASEARRIAEVNREVAVSRERIERIVADKVEPAVRAAAESGLSRAVVSLPDEDERSCRAICSALAESGYSAAAKLLDAAACRHGFVCWAVVVGW